MDAVPSSAVTHVGQTAASRPGTLRGVTRFRPGPSKRSTSFAQPSSARRGATFLAVASLSSLWCRSSRSRSRTAACAGKPAEPPAPWQLVEVPETPGQWYYWNEETGESSWDPPVSEAPVEATSPSSPTEGAWQQATTDDGDVYYYNEETGETSWTLPEAVKETPQSSAGRWRGAAGPDGTVYYYNEATKETSWTLPEGAEFVVDGEEPAEEAAAEQLEDEQELSQQAPIAAEKPAEKEPDVAAGSKEELPQQVSSEKLEDEELLGHGDDEELLEQALANTYRPAEEQPKSFQSEEDTESGVMEDDDEALLESALAAKQAEEVSEMPEEAMKLPESPDKVLAATQKEELDFSPEEDDDEELLEQALAEAKLVVEPETELLLDEDLEDEEELLEQALAAQATTVKVVEKATTQPKAVKAKRPSAKKNGAVAEAKDAPDFLAKLGLDPEEVLAQCPELKKVPLPNLQAKLQFLQQELHPAAESWAQAIQNDPLLMTADLEDLQSSLVWLEEFLWNQDWAAGFGRAALAEAIQNKPFLLYQGEEGLEGTIAWLEDHGLDDEAVRSIAADARAVPYPVEPFPWIELLQLGSERLEAGANWCNKRLGWTREQVSVHLRKEPFCLLTAATAAGVSNGRARAGYPVPEPRETFLEKGILQVESLEPAGHR